MLSQPNWLYICTLITFLLSSQTGPVGEMRVNTEMTVSVAQMFPPAVQILAGYKLAQYLVQLPDEKPTSEFTVCSYSTNYM